MNLEHARGIVLRENIAGLAALHDHAAHWWMEYVRMRGGYDPKYPGTTEQMALQQVLTDFRRIDKLLRALGNARVNRKLDAVRKWVDRGKYDKANDAYWMVRSELKKVGLLDESLSEGLSPSRKRAIKNTTSEPLFHIFWDAYENAQDLFQSRGMDVSDPAVQKKIENEAWASAESEADATGVEWR